MTSSASARCYRDIWMCDPQSKAIDVVSTRYVLRSEPLRCRYHERLAAAGAVFRDVSGWESADYYGEPAPGTFGRPECFDTWAAEHHAARNAAVVREIGLEGVVHSRRCCERGDGLCTVSGCKEMYCFRKPFVFLDIALR